MLAFTASIFHWACCFGRIQVRLLKANEMPLIIKRFVDTLNVKQVTPCAVTEELVAVFCRSSYMPERYDFIAVAITERSDASSTMS